MDENIKALLQWGIVLGVLIIIVAIIGEITGYNPAPSETMKQEVTQQIKQDHKKISDRELQNIKNKFNITDNNFSNRIIHTSDGIIIERIK